MRKITVLLFFLILTGCFETGKGTGFGIGVQGKRYSIHELKGNERGDVFLLPTRKQFQNDLVYKNYEKLFEDALIRNGLRITKDEKSAKYVGLVNYGFVTDQSSVSTVNYKVNNKEILLEAENYPINATRGRTERDIFGQPLIGLRYDRVVEFYLYDISLDKGKQVLYSKLSSTGTCNNINSVAEDLTTMLFLNYPPLNKETEQLTNYKFKIGTC